MENIEMIDKHHCNFRPSQKNLETFEKKNNNGYLGTSAICLNGEKSPILSNIEIFIKKHF